MRFMIIRKADKKTEAGVMPSGGNAEIEIRQLFELEDFGPSEAVKRMRKVGLSKKK